MSEDLSEKVRMVEVVTRRVPQFPVEVAMVMIIISRPESVLNFYAHYHELGVFAKTNQPHIPTYQSLIYKFFLF